MSIDHWPCSTRCDFDRAWCIVASWYNEEAARDMIQQELNMINQVSDDSEEVKQLVEEGFDSFLSRRALAFAELDIDNARAILIADQMDKEEEEEDQRQQQQQQQLEQQQQAQEERAMRSLYDKK
jgi:hypothetical protein